MWQRSKLWFDPHWKVLRQNILYLESNQYNLPTLQNDHLCIFSVSCILDWQFSLHVPLLSFTMENIWNTQAVPNKPRWIAVSYIYFHRRGVGVVAFSLVIKCLPDLFMLQSYKWWIFHINERSPWSPPECIVLFLHFTIREWGKIGQCVSFFLNGRNRNSACSGHHSNANTVNHCFAQIQSSYLLHHFIRGIFFTYFELISRPDLKINTHRKSETAPLWKRCGIWS